MNMSLVGCLVDWYEHHGRRLEDANNVRVSKNRLLDIMAETQTGSVATDELTSAVLWIIHDHLRETYSANTVKRHMSVLKRAVNYWRKRGLQVAVIDWPKLKMTSKVRHLDTEEQGYLLDRLEEQAYITPHATDQYHMAVLLLGTGARLNDVCNLTWDAVDFDRRRLTIYMHKTNKYVVVPMTRAVEKALRERSLNRDDAVPYVFLNSERDGPRQPHAVTGIRRVLRELDARSPVKTDRDGKATIHALRHTYASNLLQNGMSLEAVSELLGHATYEETKKYAHLSASKIADAAGEVLDQLEGRT